MVPFLKLTDRSGPWPLEALTSHYCFLGSLGFLRHQTIWMVIGGLIDSGILAVSVQVITCLASHNHRIASDISQKNDTKKYHWWLRSGSGLRCTPPSTCHWVPLIPDHGHLPIMECLLASKGTVLNSLPLQKSQSSCSWYSTGHPFMACTGLVKFAYAHSFVSIKKRNQTTYMP